MTGVMIHRVISEVDLGSPIVVQEIKFVPGEDEDLQAFEEKVHRIEWAVVIQGIQCIIREIQEDREKRAVSSSE
jgi:phosphoribosylglycinamide formyltransferase